MTGRLRGSRRYRVAVVFGTRPEAIKLVPVIRAFQARPDVVCRVCVTAQHRQLLDQVLQPFGVHPDQDLDLMRPGQSLNRLAARCLVGLDSWFRSERPDLVLVQGDTTSAFSAALAAFHLHIPVGHVEAGLRTHDLAAPWPEEANRQLIGRIAGLHFAPTAGNRLNLLREGVPGNRIHVTGNTGLDALRWILAQNRVHPPVVGPLAACGRRTRWILVTAHRRENLGPRMERICEGVRRLCEVFPDVQIIFPVHPNPAVRDVVARWLDPRRVPHVHCVEPLPYAALVAVMARSVFLLTDSGGLQEEGPALGKPVLVMRDSTERPETVRRGMTRVVGTDAASIVEAAGRVMRSTRSVPHGRFRSTPFGDGHAARRIVLACLHYLGRVAASAHRS